MTAEIARDTATAIAAVHAEPFAGDRSHGDLSGPVVVRAGRTGYVERIDLEANVLRGSASGARLGIVVRSGDFVTARDPVAYWSPGDAGATST